MSVTLFCFWLRNIDLYPASINQVPKIIKALRSKGFKLSTAAECVGDDEPHSGSNKKHKDDDDDDDDDEYSEDSNKIKQDAFVANTGSDAEELKQAQQSAQHTNSAASSIAFSTSILAACGILASFLIRQNYYTQN